jgi:hypothetical protein
MMETEAQVRRSESHIPVCASPRHPSHSRKRRTESDQGEDSLKIQLDAANKRISELESELQITKQADARSRRRLVELRAKYTQNFEALTAKLGKPKAQLPEAVAFAVNENLASVASLHSQLQEELSAFQARAEEKLKSKEIMMQQNFDARLKLLGRQLGHQSSSGDCSPAIMQRSPEQVATQLRQFEEFNSKLQTCNKSLKKRLKEAQALAEVYSDQHAAILLENAKFKRLLQERSELPPSHRSSIADELPLLNRTQRSINDSSKVAELQRELSKVRAQLIEERARKTEVELIMEKWIEETKATGGARGGTRSEIPSREREMARSLLTEERVKELLQTRAFPSVRSVSVTTLRK